MFLTSIVTLILCLCLAAGSAPAQEISVDIPFEKFVLSNGLTVIVHEDRKAPIVAVNVWYHVGSKNEKRGKTGFAHLFEHLMFNGSEHFNQDYFKALDKLGATDLNGTTNNDRTNYFQNVPSPALETVLWMESDRMGYMLGAIDQAKLDEQRGVVQNEKRQRENQPYGLVYNTIHENTYPAGHPYSWSVIGSMEDLNAASLDDVREWFKTYYGPSNATIVLAGDINVATARKMVEKYFGAIPPGPPTPKHRAWIARREGVKRQTLQDRVPQARIYKVWNTPQEYTEEADLLDLAAQVLGAGRASRLYKRLVHTGQIAIEAASSQWAAEIGGQFTMIATVRSGGSVAQVEKAMDEELAAFLKEGPTAAELERVRTQYVANFMRGLERVGGFGGKSDVLARGQVFANNPAAYKQSLERIQRATPEQVRSAAAKWLSDGVYVLEVHPFPKYAASGKDADRSKVPEPGTPPAFLPTKLQRGKLSNGLQLVLAERHQLPLVDFVLTVRAGYATDLLSGQQGTARLAMTLLDKGTKSRDSLQIQEQLERLGAQLSAASGLDGSIVNLSALKTNLDASLEIFADVLTNASFPEGEFRRQQKLMIAAIQREKVEPFAMALRVLPALVFGKGHPYGVSLTGAGTEATAARITRGQVAKFHETWIRPNNATLIITGDTTLAEITPKLEKLLAAWRPGDVPPMKIAAVEHRQAPLVYLIDRPGAVQSIVLAGHVAPPKRDASDIAISVLNNALGGAFVSRINLNLREDKHWAYGARSTIFETLGQQLFFAYAPVQTDKTKESLAELNKEFREILRERPLTAEELRRVQDRMTLQLPGQRETLRGTARSILDIVRHQLPDDYWEKYPGQVRELTLPNMASAAERLLHPDKLVWVVVGDRSKIEKGVRELNLGDLRLIDAEGMPASE